MDNQTVFYTCLMSVCSTLMFIVCLIDWTKTEKRFRIKKIMDAILPVLTYAFVVYGHYIYILNKSKVTFWMIVILGLVVWGIEVWFCVNQLVFFSKLPSRSIKGKNFVYVLISLFFALLLACTTLNYLTYIIWPNYFDIPNGLNHAAIGFEFLYYTFTLMITYSAGSIEVLHVVAKIIQMVEISLFYILFGLFFVDLIAKTKSAEGLTQE